MAIEVFNRYEYKYLVDKNTLSKLLKIFDEVLIKDEFCQKYGEYHIINYYVDTLNYQMIRDSLDKPLYKQKLRLRTYEELNSKDDYVFFEIKKKFLGLVNKRRCKLSMSEAEDLIYKKKYPIIKDYMNEQILNEIFYILKQDTYEIKNKITYNRIAFFSSDRKLRISFDFDIDSENKKYLDYGYSLMEIKTPDSIPLWLKDVLNDLNITKRSFSKYGLTYLDKLQGEK